MEQYTTNIDPEQEPQADPEAPRGTKKSFLRDLIETVLLALVLFLLLNTLTSRVRVYNVSMQPTLKQGYLLVVNKIVYRVAEPKRGDVVVFHHNGNKNEDYIKRMIGLPGDVVSVANGVVSINGEVLTEPYIREMPFYSGTWTVPAGEYFVLGDNRNDSSDSHEWGFVKKDWLVGKAFFIYYPFDQIKVLSAPQQVRDAGK